MSELDGEGEVEVEGKGSEGETGSTVAMGSSRVHNGVYGFGSVLCSLGLGVRYRFSEDVVLSLASLGEDNE